MSYLMVNEELRIQSCSIEDLVLEKENFADHLEDPETITIIYNPVTDTVIINQDRVDYELYMIMADTYLTVNQRTRYKLRKQAEEITRHGFDDTFNLLNEVVRRRELSKANRQAEELKRIIGKQYSDPYMNNLNIIEALRRMDERRDCFRDYDVFMLGYIQGIRAERARRKKHSTNTQEVKNTTVQNLIKTDIINLVQELPETDNRFLTQIRFIIKKHLGKKVDL